MSLTRLSIQVGDSTAQLNKGRKVSIGISPFEMRGPAKKLAKKAKALPLAHHKRAIPVRRQEYFDEDEEPEHEQITTVRQTTKRTSRTTSRRIKPSYLAAEYRADFIDDEEEEHEGEEEGDTTEDNDTDTVSDDEPDSDVELIARDNWNTAASQKLPSKKQAGVLEDSEEAADALYKDLLDCVAEVCCSGKEGSTLLTSLC